MRMAFKVKYNDGREVDAVAKPKDIVAFERQYGVGLTSFADQKQLKIEWLFYLAWSPLHRAGLESHPFDEFLDYIDEIEAVEDENAEATGPFPTAPSGEPLPG